MSCWCYGPYGLVTIATSGVNQLLVSQSILCRDATPAFVRCRSSQSSGLLCHRPASGCLSI